ncbi:RUS family member 1 [Spodoptera frugiperda]|uniref:RUS family member 1 n=1 Tax=Spodoptera frugiperda TaxID=7108 RepID=A0A9R0E8J6_SPOFR|nr:RUS family member 1 [Spodoptera frugiperda]XP_050560376.1 RUS family member 1 [Spodoptera frugiperda]
MFTIHEGEVIYKEIYGSLPKQRIYVKPPDQSNVVVLNEEKFNEFANLFTRVFLPQGYPYSVSRDYSNYQIWDTAQAFCSTITGILATQEVLRGVGVGDTTATPLAATVTWVLKDGCGHLGKIYFAYTHGTHLDAYSKKWRLYADVLNDAAMCIEIALPAFKNYTTAVLCVSTVMKAIVGVAGGATRAAMTQHHAIRSNLADVSAKDSAQETAVNLIASLTALTIITIFGSSLTVFTTMMIFHIIFNYMAVRSVCLRTLNEPRFLQIIDAYLNEEIIAKPCTVNRNEPVVFLPIGPNSLDRQLCGFQIKIGHSMKKLVDKNPKAYFMINVKGVYKHNDYILVHCLETRKIYIYPRDSATSDSILCAYFHAVLYGIVICAINDIPLNIYKNPANLQKPFPVICETLQQAEWSKVTVENLPLHSKFNYEPSFELMDFLNKIVQREWVKVRVGLQKVGWEVNKNLLVVDEWRICTAKLIATQISVRENLIPKVVAHSVPKIKTFNKHEEVTDKQDKLNAYLIEPDTDNSDTNIGKGNREATQEQDLPPRVYNNQVLSNI